jgi:hypothetical protein
VLASRGAEGVNDPVIQGTAASAARPGFPAVTAYSVNSARSIIRPYLAREAAAISSTSLRI